ncbi:MAG: bifunctional methylenetetrahydrofolate dehydrogenase/methenyltetrahydrofolate cyclohydrolase FolD [Armatimonadota bacterium]|nr:bifunctional methylenetetrahydrofolate dehydrogenase/methenyltetrahydrofolate cyclohydrolase FolD [Armatimonadota bacterium]MDR7472405.1 bifunctional methylenetetrahydrofolate dehydrogenase/methenyltetrahydrofolate cyclohydrolase FolD [Armatimonadota bacterium]
MAATILDGRALAAQIEAEVAAQAQALTSRYGVSPALAAILVGDDPASHLYVRRKAEACGRAGMRSETFHLPADASQEEVLALIDQLNARADIHGILPQQPMPAHIDPRAVFDRIHPAKDVDGLGPANMAALLVGRPHLVPCTPAGVMRLLAHAGIDPAGREAVVVGRSIIVGRPMALLLLNAHATVTWCHTRTRDLAAHTRRADILVVAAGRPGLITGPMIKPGAVVIDVGISRKDGKLVGDVEFASAVEVAGWITPVPGGVGPMTIAMLLHNTVRAAEQQLRAGRIT